jgi:hypothetical protein
MLLPNYLLKLINSKVPIDRVWSYMHISNLKIIGTNFKHTHTRTHTLDCFVLFIYIENYVVLHVVPNIENRDSI